MTEVPHGVVEPILAEGQTCIRFKCRCGWCSSALRPEARGTLRTICTEYRDHQHLAAVVGGDVALLP